MGGSPSKPEHEDEALRINHPKFRKAQLLESEQLVRSIIAIEHESDYEEWQSKLNKITNIDDQVILIPKAFQYTRRAICGSSGTVQIDYDYYPYIFSEELRNREKVQKYFEEPEIWYLLYSLVTAAHDFQKVGSKVGDVRPENIFINQEGHVKISNLFSWPGEVTNYTKTVYDNEKTYLAPEQAEAAREGQSETFIDKFKAQSFSIGLTVLQSCMIRQMSSLYLHNKSFDDRNFARIISQWWGMTFKSTSEDGRQQIRDKQYSDTLKTVVAALCEIKPDERMLADEVYTWLKAYHRQINQLSPFEPGLPPYRLINKYTHLFKKQNNKDQPVSNPPAPQPYWPAPDPYYNKFLQYADPNRGPQPLIPPNPTLRPNRPPEGNYHNPIPNQPLISFTPSQNQQIYQYPRPQEPQFVLPQGPQYSLPPQGYIYEQNRVKNEQPRYGAQGNDFLRQIDEQIARSRQGFR